MGSAAVTTTVRPDTDVVAGFIAGEGCFTSGGHRDCRFVVSLGATDSEMVDFLKGFFGVGHTYWYARRKDHYDDEAIYAVRALRDLVEVIVPFMDEHLPPCHKRVQYEAWRSELVDYWDHKAKRRRPCTVDGCDRPRRAKGLCRQHYYAANGR